MRMQPHTAAAGYVITQEDHLRVHQWTKARAHAIWVSSGCRSGTVLRDWLQAEDEVLVEFCRQHMRPSAPGQHSCEKRKKSAAGMGSNRRAAAVYLQIKRFPQLLKGKDL
jgi:hypothetical protein